MEEARRLLPYIRPYLPLVLLAVVLLVACGLLEAVIIMLLAPIFDQLAPGVGGASGIDKFAFLREFLGLGDVPRKSIQDVAIAAVILLNSFVDHLEHEFILYQFSPLHGRFRYIT